MSSIYTDILQFGNLLLDLESNEENSVFEELRAVSYTHLTLPTNREV